MIVRFRGGRSGFSEYLRTGIKAGRPYTRDQLDKRIPLEGDLDTFDKILSTMDGDGESYIHITLGMAEQDLPESVLLEIQAEFKSLLMAAFDPDEFYWFSEAHRARIKNCTDLTTGQDYERHDHIHIGLLKTNLLTGGRLDPVGEVLASTHWIDAIQEHINNKFGLVSPKDRPREKITEADIFWRDGLDDFKPETVRDAKEAALKMVQAFQIRDLESLQKTLQRWGDVKVVNQGKAGREYLAWRPEGHKRYINLREKSFTSDFGRPLEKKVGVGKRSPAEIQRYVNDWVTKRSREIKYLNSGARKKYKAYRNATPDEQLRMLDTMEQAFYAKHAKTQKGDHHEHRAARKTNHRVLRQRDVEIARGEPPSATVHSVRSMHERHVDRHPRNAKVLLQGPVHAQLDGRRASAGNALRRDGNTGRGSGVTDTNQVSESYQLARADTVLAHLAREFADMRAQSVDELKEDLARAKREIDPDRLLAHLNRTHALRPDDYIISAGSDGSPRIRHKNSGTNYNAIDFLQKHIALAFPDARDYLLRAYRVQLQGDPAPLVPAPVQQALWERFIQESPVAAHRRQKREQTDIVRALRSQIRQLRADYARDRRALRGRAMSRADYTLELSILRTTKADLEAEVAATLRAEVEKLERIRTISSKKDQRDLYRMWLVERAQAGDELAIMELRRQRIKPERKQRGAMFIGLVAQPQPARAKSLRHRVTKSGDIVYFDDQGRQLFIDTARTVYVVDRADATVEKAMRLAVAKFGSKGFAVQGPDEFIEQVIRIAAENDDMRIEFADVRHAEMLQRLRDARKPSLPAVAPAPARDWPQFAGRLDALLQKPAPSDADAPGADTPPDLSGLRTKVETAAKAQAERAKNILPAAPSTAAARDAKKDT